LKVFLALVCTDLITLSRQFQHLQYGTNTPDIYHS